MQARIRGNPETLGNPDSRDHGFVLVEILVVSLIVAILAAVAIPMYAGYIKNQKRQAALALAQTASITASSIFRRTGAAPSTADLNAAIFLPNPGQFDVSVVPGPPYYVKVVEQSSDDTVWAFAKF